jgi:ubiquinone/menaquinone biosynthesis C-methylase UbiE
MDGDESKPNDLSAYCREYSVCTSVERLPFRENSMGAIVCVGEVLAYCDPAAAIGEFARVLVRSGLLICD